jgi:CubicO group peptidase (beta-lactamase class C family)
MRFQNGPETIDRRTLLVRGGAGFASLLVAGCSRNEAGGFAADGLERLRSGLQRHVDARFAPGVVGLVARGNETDAFVLGKTAFQGGADLRRDSIFRIASMTKAITAAAVMMLVDEGKVRLDETVDRLLPELANRRVLRSIDAAVDDTVPAKRPLTVQDLLTFRCGLGMLLAPPDRYPIQHAIAALGINGVGFGPPDITLPMDGDAWMRKIGTLPLFAQPGEDWFYTAGSNIQGVLVARASGRPLSRFFEERIFGPLEMKDTAFFVPAPKIDRLVHAYRPQNGALVVSDDPATGKWRRPPTFEQGDSGLVSTVDDYLAFARMLLGDGGHRGQTLLTPASARAMKTNHLTAAQRAGGEQILGRGRGWGYGMSVVTDTIQGHPPASSFGWIGGFGSSWITDPVRGLTMILFTQREFVSAAGDPIHQEFQANAYRAAE